MASTEIVERCFVRKFDLDDTACLLTVLHPSPLTKDQTITFRCVVESEGEITRCYEARASVYQIQSTIADLSETTRLVLESSPRALLDCLENSEEASLRNQKEASVVIITLPIVTMNYSSLCSIALPETEEDGPSTSQNIMTKRETILAREIHRQQKTNGQLEQMLREMSARLDSLERAVATWKPSGIEQQQVPKILEIELRKEGKMTDLFTDASYKELQEALHDLLVRDKEEWYVSTLEKLTDEGTKSKTFRRVWRKKKLVVPVLTLLKRHYQETCRTDLTHVIIDSEFAMRELLQTTADFDACDVRKIVLYSLSSGKTTLQENRPVLILKTDCSGRGNPTVVSI